MVCKGTCVSFGLLSKNFKSSLYSKGYSYCTRCAVFFKHEGVFCPCCGYRIRKCARTAKVRKRRNEGVARY